MDFQSKLTAAQDKNDSLLCVGLDPDMEKLPASVKTSAAPYFEFNKAIIDATADLVCAYKPNSAFYEGLGLDGIQQLKQTCDYIAQTYPEIPIILDYKRADIGNTNKYYADFAFGYLHVDAVTIQPYLGRNAVQVFLDYKNKGIIVLAKTSNEGSGEFQDLEVNGRKLYLEVAEKVTKEWNANGNCLLVVGATYPAELADMRQLVGDDMTFLVPGIGAQGGDVEATVKAGLNTAGKGIVINSARDIIYASNGEDFGEAARVRVQSTRDEINKYR